MRLSRSSIIQIDKKNKCSLGSTRAFKHFTRNLKKTYSVNYKVPIHEIKYTKHLEKNTQNLKNNSPNQGKHCTKQLQLFPKTKKFHTKHEKILTKSKNITPN